MRATAWGNSAGMAEAQTIAKGTARAQISGVEAGAL